MPDGWDVLAVVGLGLIAAGLWLLWGPGAALMVVGVGMLLAGMGGAMRR